MKSDQITTVSSATVPILFVGSGNIAFGNDNVRWNHSLRIERFLGPRLNVVGIIDPSTERVHQVLEQKKGTSAAVCYQQTQHFVTLEEAAAQLAEGGIVPQLIVLGAPPYFRGTGLPGRNLEERLVQAFGSTPAIFCEKPLSTARPHETAPVAELLRKSGNIVSVGYMLRYLKVIQVAVSLIREKGLAVMAVDARYTCAYSKVRKVDWWNKSKQCGPIVEQATHFCDLCRYLGGEVVLDSVRAHALEHYEPAGKLSHMAINESSIPEAERIPRVTSAIWKFENGAVGSLTHAVALHGIKYSNEIVVTTDGYQLRLVDLYSNPTLYVRSPESESEDTITFPDDDPFYQEFATLLHIVDSKSDRVGADNITPSGPVSLNSDQVLSSYADASKTFEFTWKIRDESERSH